MPMNQKNYPKNWEKIAERIKKKNNYKCERCGHCNDKLSGHVLTVHHLMRDTTINEDWALASLCQRCHLSVQNRVNMEQGLLFPKLISKWFIPHYEGFLKWKKQKIS